MDNNGCLVIATYSDIHIGCRNTPAEEIVDALIDDIKRDTRENPLLRMIIISGDLWETQLTLSHDGSVHGIRLMTYLDQLSRGRNILVYILEGTPRHDRSQSKILNGIYDRSTNLHHVTGLTHLDIPIDGRVYSFLFIEDEYRTVAKDTELEVTKLMHELNIVKFDFIVMHGYFIGSLPSNGVDAHDPEFYNNIVNYAAYCGHVHKHFTIGKIISPGSHNRVAHGEQDKKGHILSYLTNQGIVHKFVENVNAWTYDTINAKELDYEEFVNVNANSLKKYRDGSNMRVIVSEINAPQFNVRKLQSTWPQFNWVVERGDKKKDKLKTVAKNVIDSIPLTKTTIRTVVSNESRLRNIDEGTIQAMDVALLEHMGVLYDG